MAQRIVTIYTDDLSGTQGDDVVTHEFSLDGVQYEIDLNPDGHQQLLDALAPFLKAGRRTRTASGRRSTNRGGAGLDPSQVREWAKNRGLDVNARGRVSRDIIEKYEAAH
ncbi:Lsr2 family protein [Streptomyces sp. NPDC086783]|uniref:histone-like nucleoid-structuring protein Lsr2 n=1 Tax=Streptomyces sp. NPDC086783 TaxID=3365758 RepID=UPI00380DB0F6